MDEPTRLALTARNGERAGLATPTEGENIVADYGTIGFTLRRHPLALLRKRLARQRIHTAAEIAESRNGQFIRAAGCAEKNQRCQTKQTALER